MKWKKEQTFDCETYLQTLAMGIHSPVAEEHVANCNFCRDIYHGGSEEFPLSLKEAADAMRAEKKRKARRKFFKNAAQVGAAMVIASFITAQFVTTTESNQPRGIRTHLKADLAGLTGSYSAQGRSGVESWLAPNDQERIEVFLEWLGRKRDPLLYDLAVRYLQDSRAPIQKAALLALLSFDPVDLKPHLADLQRAESVVSPSLRAHVQHLLHMVEAA